MIRELICDLFKWNSFYMYYHFDPRKVHVFEIWYHVFWNVLKWNLMKIITHLPWTKKVKKGLSHGNGWWGLVKCITDEAGSPSVKSQKSPFLKKLIITISSEKSKESPKILKFAQNDCFFEDFFCHKLINVLAVVHTKA